MVDIESKQESQTASSSLCLYLWWGILASTAYVYDFQPIWAFATLFGISLKVTILKLIWRKSWFLTLKARCCCCRFSWCSWLLRSSDPKETTKKQHSPWRKQVTLFFEMSLPYFRESARGRWLFVGMILLTLIVSAVHVVFSYVSKDFYNALEHKDAAAFSRILILYTAILVAGAPTRALYNFQRDRLSIAWRDWMTNRTLDLYSKNRVYYLLDKDIDNPDQRIAQDVMAFTSFSLKLLVTLLDNTINLISFSVILYTIEPQLFLIIIAYAFGGTVVTSFIGGPLVPLNFERLQYEADFRFSLVRLREHAESIAFYKGEGVEVESLRIRLERVLGIQRDIVGTERNLQMFTVLYQYLTWVLPIAVVAPSYFAGAIELGVVTQARSAFLQVIGDLSM
jgi:putative ATP-binding cassette transporter